MIITLKDGSVRELEKGESCAAIAKQISHGLAAKALCAKVNGVLTDLSTKLSSDCTVEILTFDDEEGREVFRHTTAHILAHAVKNIFPTCKLAKGPAIANGYFYDVDFRSPITVQDLEKIEKEMEKIVAANFPIERTECAKRTAQSKVKSLNEDYKLQIINEKPAGTRFSFYKQGEFVDLCTGPHLPSTGYVKFFKLTSIAGAYWQNDEKNKMLTRIYGTSFTKKADLEKYLTDLEQAKNRDHNKLGRELGIFLTDENVGQGLPLLAPKGAKILQVMQRFVEDEEQRRGYLPTKTPLMAKSDLYKISGHWQHYKDGMFVLGDENKDDEIFALRPMTCPFQFAVYKNGLKSYRDLPVRYSETATLFRNENSGEMHGLIRVRQFTLSDGHIICTPSQVEQEFVEVMNLIYFMLDALGLREDVSYRFSRWDPNKKGKYIDNPDAWNQTESQMKRILDHLGLKYFEAIGEAAFYGPKLDVQIKNVWGKEDTIITIQIDFANAERFDLEYVDVDNSKKRPVIIHRSSIGCYERTLALLIEKYGGAFPLWLSYMQVKVLSLTDRTAQDATEICQKLLKCGIRAEVDNRAEKIGYKIREATKEKIPYMLIVGDKEKEQGVVSVRHRTEGDIGFMRLDEFIALIEEKIAQLK